MHLPLCLLVLAGAVPAAAIAEAEAFPVEDLPVQEQAGAVRGESIQAGSTQTGTDSAAREALAAQLAPRIEQFGLDEGADLVVQEVATDPDGTRHVRLQQRYRGLRVWGAQAILHLAPDGTERPVTDALVRGIRLEVRPNLDQAEALAIAHRRESPQGAYARLPSAELVVYPATALTREEGAGEGRNARDFAPRLTRLHLAWHVRLELANGAPETRHDDFLVDAHTGAVLKRWSALLTLRAHRARDKPRPGSKGKAATTVGRSQYSGEVKLGSLAADCGFVMSDPTRAHISTRDLAGGTRGHGVLYVSQTGEWGDGQNYDPGRGSRSKNGQTAAVDAQYGLQTTWDFYKHILERNGIDGKGRTAYNLVHYSQGYDNAFWDNDCFCMTYGDGDMFKTLTALDVVGHEVSHGLCRTTADLEYDGEPGCLNEANSDIFGVMIHLYGTQAGGQGRELPARGGAWTIGADLGFGSGAKPLRYLYKPSLDGFSPDAWSPDLETMDVHIGSGPMNRAFYFLSQGASPKVKDPAHSKYLPKGMAGIGNDKAIRIWWRALSTYLTPRSRYLDARHGAIRSAADLFGKNSPEVRAVRLAFHGINVDDRRNANLLEE
jgi:Zn-dependent metalloprotease